MFRVPHVRLRRDEEDAIQRGMSAPRELPKARAVGAGDVSTPSAHSARALPSARASETGGAPCVRRARGFLRDEFGVLLFVFPLLEWSGVHVSDGKDNYFTYPICMRH